MPILNKINDLGKWMEGKTMQEEGTLIRATRTAEFESRHTTIARVNHFIDNYRGFIILFIIMFMLLTLYLIWWYDDSTFRTSYLFFPVAKYCEANYTSTPSGPFRTSQYTVTYCYNPYPNVTGSNSFIWNYTNRG